MSLLIILLLIPITLFSERTFYLMGTYFEAEVEGKELKAYKLGRELEEKLSDFIETSEISRINKNAGIKPVKVSRETYEVIRLSLEVCEETEGAFDPTVGSYTVNFLRKRVLSKEEALSLINCEYIKLYPEERKVYLSKKGMALDLGGIGKGYALEVIARKLSIKRGFLALSGDIKVWGERRVVGVYNPINGKVLAYLVNEKDFCISTSGNYRRKHILGSSDFLQVTVVHENCTYADAYATAIFSGGEKLLKKLMDRKELGILVLYPNGKVLLNHTFTTFFSEIHFQ